MWPVRGDLAELNPELHLEEVMDPTDNASNAHPNDGRVTDGNDVGPAPLQNAEEPDEVFEGVMNYGSGTNVTSAASIPRTIAAHTDLHQQGIPFMISIICPGLRCLPTMKLPPSIKLIYNPAMALLTCLKHAIPGCVLSPLYLSPNICPSQMFLHRQLMSHCMYGNGSLETIYLAGYIHVISCPKWIDGTIT